MKDPLLAPEVDVERFKLWQLVKLPLCQQPLKPDETASDLRVVRTLEL